MQDLNALKGKSLAELREIAKVLGIGDVMLKKRELMEKIAEAAAAEAPASDNTPAQARIFVCCHKLFLQISDIFQDNGNLLH